MGGLGVKVQHSPLTLLVVLTTLTLPCERDLINSENKNKNKNKSLSYADAQRAGGIAPAPQSLVGALGQHGLNPELKWVSAYTARSTDVVPVTLDAYVQQNKINSDLLNKNKIISQPTANMSQFLDYSDLHLTSDRTVSGMLSSSHAALGTLGHPVQATMGAHPVVTWSTSVHPVHRHVTSSYPLVCAVGPSPSVDYDTIAVYQSVRRRRLLFWSTTAAYWDAGAGCYQDDVIVVDVQPWITVSYCWTFVFDVGVSDFWIIYCCVVPGYVIDVCEQS